MWRMLHCAKMQRVPTLPVQSLQCMCKKVPFVIHRRSDLHELSQPIRARNRDSNDVCDVHQHSICPSSETRSVSARTFDDSRHSAAGRATVAHAQVSRKETQPSSRARCDSRTTHGCRPKNKRAQKCVPCYAFSTVANAQHFCPQMFCRKLWWIPIAILCV